MFILGMGVILLGVVLMLIMYKIRPEFFRGQVLARGI
ncbi:amino acid protein [Arthrobacter sp. Hiyo6]|nr:amino acid protein [Arthrobacter sp. Hiyo6]